MFASAVDQLQPRAQAALSNSPFYELRELQVEQCQDELCISGCVSSFYHKQLAQEVVRSVSADAKVINTIRVKAEENAR
ncbi:MAG: BON domain-containing protein [Pirellulales bacterium]|nr:BON domain-containing protein [Pirellulales bacterium]